MQIESKVFVKVKVGGNSKQQDEIAFRNLPHNKIELIVLNFDVESKKRAEVATITINITDAKRLRAALDLSIKSQSL